jgi:hypothetical protein
MTRTYAKVYVSIWADSDFKALSVAAQGLYFRLLTDSKLSMCGVADWRPNRISQSAGDTSVGAIRQAGAELERARFVLIDEGTEEVLIRSFIRHDGVLKSPNLVKSMLSDWLAIASPKLQAAVCCEVQRTRESEPDMKGLGELPEWFRPGSVEVPEPVVEPIGNPSDVVPDGFPSSIPILQPATCSQQPPTGDAAQKRGHRLPKGWMPDEEVIEAMRNECPNVDLTAEHRKFTDHWNAKTGRDAAKLDWNATWRNWIRNARPSLGARRSGNDIDWDAAAARAAAADAARSAS